VPGLAATERVVVSIVRDPALVRTVRLVAASLVRRAGGGVEFAEEIRLAVGEACALMIGEKAEPDGQEPVRITLSVGEEVLVEVASPTPVEVRDPPDSDVDGIERWVLLRELAGGFRVSHGDSGTTVTLSWPMR